MKSSILFSIAFCALAFISCSKGQQQPVVVNGQQQTAQVQPDQALPEPVMTFINQTFPEATVSLIEVDNEAMGTEFDVTLNDGTEIDFDTNNQWEKVDCKAKPVPEALVPTTIADYVKTTYPNVAITKIDRKHNGFEIELL
ncbi:MAG: PepSY-like domain-containing protein, partial [Muribaculaceae bacterium]|nr:PepSY-like domain-containing protein [Muribaculaceae bacterium]